MKQLLVLSGKGGTGKTTVVSSFVELLDAKVFADCDVDAPNLHLVTNMDEQPNVSDYYGMDKAFINSKRCIECGDCANNCRFHAIEKTDNGYHVNAFSCEGCSVCETVCPVGAIEMKQDIAGELMLYATDKVFSTAKLKMGSGTSGKLVTEVKKAMKSSAHAKPDILRKSDVAIIDGSPGIGCPVIASVSGVDVILLVTEPTVSGMSDMKRVIELADHFKIRVAICTNKFDVNTEKTEAIKRFAKSKNIPFVGVIPYDKGIAEATNEGKSIIRKECDATPYMKDVFHSTMELLDTCQNE